MSLGDIHLAEIIRLYADEEQSLAEVGRKFDVSRQAIYAVLTDAGVPIRSKSEAKSVAREREIASDLDTKGEDIRCALLDGQSVSAVSNTLDVSPSSVQRVYSGIDAITRRSLRYKGSSKTWTDAELIEFVQTVADVHECTPGVTLYSKYRSTWPELGLPHSMTIVKRFDGWSNACVEAGLTPNSRPPKGTGVSNYTDEQIGKALQRSARHLDAPPSIADYRNAKMTAESDPSNKLEWPAAGTIITRYKGWTKALKVHGPFE